MKELVLGFVMNMMLFGILADAAPGIRSEVTVVAVAARGIARAYVSKSLGRMLSSIKAY